MQHERKFVCIQCGCENDSLIKTFRKGLFNLSRCIKCSKVVDPYLEYDFVLILLDLLLLKKKAFYHVIFNIQPLERKVLLSLVLILSETCARWVLVRDRMVFDIFVLYGLFTISAIEFLIYIGMMLVFLRFYSNKRSLEFNGKKIFEVMLISSYGKIFCMAASIWCYQDTIMSILLTRCFVFISTLLALNVLVKFGRIRISLFLLCATLSSQLIGFSVP